MSVVILLLLAGCSGAAVTNQPATATASESLPIATVTLQPTDTPTEIPWAAKQVLAQYGSFGGDGPGLDEIYEGLGMPQWILYTDGQMIIQKEGEAGDWLEETTLTTAQMCSFLKDVEALGFFTMNYDNSSFFDTGVPTANPIYQFDETTEFGEGGSNYFLLVNGAAPRQIEIYYRYVPYLIPEAKALYDYFKAFSSSFATTLFQPQALLLRFEKETPGVEDATPAAWPQELPSFTALEPHALSSDASFLISDAFYQVLVAGDGVEPVLNAFDHLMVYRFFMSEGEVYHVAARPFLPHETLQDFFKYPQAEPLTLPFDCSD